MKFLSVLFSAAILLSAACTKNKKLDTSTLSVYVPDYYLATATTVYFTSALSDGDYFVRYSLAPTDQNAGSKQVYSKLQATLTFKNGKSSLQTPVLKEKQCMTLTIDSISNSDGKGTILSLVSHFCDSSGVMTATINGQPFKTHRVLAGVDDTVLIIIGDIGTVTKVGSSQLCIGIAPFTRASGSFNLYTAPVTASHAYNYYYPPTITSGVPADFYFLESGQANITTVTPILNGTFSFTTNNGIKIENGTFTVAAP